MDIFYERQYIDEELAAAVAAYPASRDGAVTVLLAEAHMPRLPWWRGADRRRADDLRGACMEDPRDVPSRTNDPLTATCPKCASDRLHWSLRRPSRSETPVRFFAWQCRACGASWIEAIVLGMEPIIEDVYDDYTN